MRDKKLYDVALAFCGDMFNRLEDKEVEGFVGWDNTETCTKNSLKRRILEHLDKPRKKDMVDLANLAMFLYARMED